MASAADILLRIKGQDQTGSAFNKVGEKAKNMQSMVSSAVGMAAGMVGYDLVSGLTEAGKSAINSSQQLDYFGGRLKMSAKESADFRNQINDLQKDFRKVDMTAVGATAEEIAVKMGLPTEKVGDLTKMTAVLSSTFVKEGRTQEDAVLAVGDALDGQFKRLQEIGITQEELKANGWSGEISDQTTLIDSLNKTMKDMGYEKTAKDITNLDEAWNALSVAGGRLLADIIIPLTPAFMALTDSIINTIDFVKDNGWVQGVLLIGGIAISLGLLAGAAAAAEVGIGALIAGAMPGFITSLWGAASAFMGISVAGAPLWAILAVIAAIAFAVYEVGIYFGWWTDLSSMLAAISNGVRRLWEAFINSPQVQGTIRMVKGALEDLWEFMQPMISWIQTQWENVFGKSGGNPDAVRMIWQAFQTLGTIAGDVFHIISDLAGQAWTALSPIVEAVRNIIVQFMAFANGNASLETTVLTILTMVRRIYTTIGQLMLQIGQRIFNGIVNALRPIPARMWQFLVQAVGRLVTFASMAVARARNAGLRILNAIIGFIRQLPGRVFSYMMQVPGRIASAAGSAVGAASSLASQVVSAVTSGITGVADSIYTEFMNIPGKINGAVTDAVNAASNFGSGIKDAVLNALNIHSPGIIQTKIATEFADIPGRIGESNDYVYGAARNYAGNILNGFNAPQIPLGTVRQNANYTPNTSSNGNTTIIYVEKGAMPLNAHNLTAKEATSVVITAFETLGDNNPTVNGG